MSLFLAGALFVSALAAAGAARAQPMSCHVERSPGAASFEGLCVVGDTSLPLVLTPPDGKRGERGGLAKGTWEGTLDLGALAPVEWIVERADVDGIVFRTPLGWFPLGSLESQANELSFGVHLGRMVEPDALDLTILRRARELLAEEARWDRADDRVCEPADETFSLYCAMHRASVEETGSFEHRRPALQEVRLAVEQLSLDREFEHRLRDFNNESSLAEVQAALELAILRVERRLAGEPRLRLQPVTTLGPEADRTASLELGDVDGDGDLDVVEVNGRHWPGQNRIYLNNGEGGLGLRRPLGDEEDTSYAAPLADFDGDGDLDVAVGNDRVRNLLLFNDGSGRFSAGPTFGGIESTRGVAVADLDGDGHLDVLLTNRGDPNAIHFGDGRGAFPRTGTFGNQRDSTIAVAVGDLDGDGDLDLALANRDGQGNAVLLNDGQGGFERAVAYGTGSDETRGVALGDLDADGDLDIVNANIGEPDAVVLGDGAGGFAEPIPFGPPDGPSYAVALADLDRDGDLDIVVGRAGARNAVYSNRGDGRGFEELPFGDPEAVTYGVAVGDLDGDGFPEILTANSDGPNVVYVNRTLSLRP